MMMTVIFRFILCSYIRQIEQKLLRHAVEWGIWKWIPEFGPNVWRGRKTE